MTDARIISCAAILQAAVEDAADAHRSSQSQVFRAGNENQENIGGWGEDGLVQRRVWDLSHQLIWVVLMGEASPVSLPFFGGGERSSC